MSPMGQAGADAGAAQMACWESRLHGVGVAQNLLARRQWHHPVGTPGLALGVGAEPVLILCRGEKSTPSAKPRLLPSAVCRLESFLTYETNEQHTTGSSLQVWDCQNCQRNA